jgi:hypothetical protein
MTHPQGSGRTTEGKANEEPDMKQSTAGKWNEGVKLLASDYLQLTMQRRTHRQRGAERTGLCHRVANAVAAKASYQPAAESVRAAKTAFAAAGLAAKTAKPRKTRARFELLFDSLSRPDTPGTRSAATRARQLLYRADPYQIDLQIELQPESDRLVVTGQLVDLSDPELVGRDVAVILSDGREFIVNTVTNQFGEFRCEVKNSGDLELSFLGRSKKPIIILLPGALGQSSGARE